MDDKNINNNLNNDGENIIQENINNNQMEQEPRQLTKDEKAAQTVKDVVDVGAPIVAEHFGGPVASEVTEKALQDPKVREGIDKAANKLVKGNSLNPLNPANTIGKNALAKAQKPVSELKPIARSANNLRKNTSKNPTELSEDNKELSDALAKSKNKNPKGLSNSKSTSDNNSKQKKSIFGNSSNEETEHSESPGADLLSSVGRFFKKNPGLVFTIVGGLIFLALIFLPIILIAACVMYVIDTLSSVSDFFQDTGEIIWNTITLHGTRTNQNVYLFNIEEQADSWLDRDDVDKTTFDLEKIRIYTNSATFYSNVVNPDAIDEVLKDPDNDDKETPSDESETDEEETSSDESETDKEEKDKVENPEDLVQFVGTGDELRQKYGNIKDHPKELIPKMFECAVYEGNVINKEKSCEDSDVESDSKKYIFSEEAYEKYLTDTYVMREFIECSDCGYDTATDEKKKSDAKKMAEEIISQAKSSYVNYNANDQSNYNAYSIMVSGITVKDNDGNVIGTYSFSEYVQTIVERDAGSYNNEIKKAYALVVISKTLSNSTNGEVTEFDFDYDKVTQSTTDSVEEVIDLKIMREGKVYYGSFDFEKASEVEQQEYETILKTLYGEDISIEESISNGLQLDTDTGFYMRVSAPDINDLLYFGSEGSRPCNIGECAWYVQKRANEITKTLYPDNSSLWWNGSANAKNFCELAEAKKFNVCNFSGSKTNCQIKQGAIMVWNGDFGHVAIVEKVDGNMVTYSDAMVTYGSYGAMYGNNWQKVEDALDLPGGFACNTGNKQSYINRFENCTSNPSRPCFATKQQDSHTFINNHVSGGKCIIYLTEPGG